MSTTPIVVTWHQALVAAGSAESDSVWEQDQLLSQWLEDRTCKVIDSSESLQNLPRVDVVIIKEKSNDQS